MWSWSESGGVRLSWTTISYVRSNYFEFRAFAVWLLRSTSVSGVYILGWLQLQYLLKITPTQMLAEVMTQGTGLMPSPSFVRGRLSAHIDICPQCEYGEWLKCPFRRFELRSEKWFRTSKPSFQDLLVAVDSEWQQQTQRAAMVEQAIQWTETESRC